MTYPTPPPHLFFFKRSIGVNIWLESNLASTFGSIFGLGSFLREMLLFRGVIVRCISQPGTPPPPKTPEPSLTPQSARKQHLLFHPIALSTVVTTKYPSAGSTSCQPPLPQTPDIKAVHQAIGPASASNADKALLRAHTRSPCPAVLMRQEHLLNTPPTSASTRSLARGTFPLGLISASPPTTSAQRCGIPTDRAHVGVDYFT